MIIYTIFWLSASNNYVKKPPRSEAGIWKCFKKNNTVETFVFCSDSDRKASNISPGVITKSPCRLGEGTWNISKIH